MAAATSKMALVVLSGNSVAGGIGNYTLIGLCQFFGLQSVVLIRPPVQLDALPPLGLG